LPVHMPEAGMRTSHVSQPGLVFGTIVVLVATSCIVVEPLAFAYIRGYRRPLQSFSETPCRASVDPLEVGSRCAGLIRELSQLPAHPTHDALLEQYTTDVEVAAFWLHAIDGREPFANCQSVIDLGAGNGLLGIGALLLGAPRVYFAEVDPTACEAIRKGLHKLDLMSRAEVICVEVCRTQSELQPCDVVIMNPPWGQLRKFADRPFLEVAVGIARQSVHLMQSAGVRHIEPWARDAGWYASRWLEAELTLPKSYAHQRKTRAFTDAAMWWLQKRRGAVTPRQQLARSDFVISSRSRWAKLARLSDAGVAPLVE